MKRNLILGPPGTGKTTTLLNKVDELLNAGVQPEQIAYVSFTRKAAYEARDRAVERFNLEPKRFKYFRTLHSLAFQELGLSRSDVMQRQHWQELSQVTGYTLEPSTSWEDGMFTAGGTHGPFLFHLNLARMMCRDYLAHWEHITQRDNKPYYLHGASPRFSRKDFLHLAHSLDRYKEVQGVVDFTDMLERGQHLDPIDAEYVIVDEAQDLSALQWRYCKRIFGNAQQIWIAGDDDQAIYQWAGADLYTFRHLEAQREVLSQSWRLPLSVHQFAHHIARAIFDRYDKHFEPKDEPGSVNKVRAYTELPLDSEEWMLLTRTRAQQQELTEYLRAQGYVYEQHGTSSIKPAHEKAIRSWTALRNGRQITGDQVRGLYDLLRSRVEVEHGSKKKVESLESEAMLSMQELRDHFGLLAQGEWYDVLKRMPEADAEYYRRALRKRNKFEDCERIRVNTIHSVKGGECDNVYFSTNLGPTAYKMATRYGLQGKDPETRVMYVAASRAKQALWINPAAQYTLPAMEHALTRAA